MTSKMFRDNGRVTGLATGFYELDERTTGLQPGNLIVVGGRTSMGKTTLALNISRNVAATRLWGIETNERYK